MQLLQELLSISKASSFDTLLEDLGNLKQLGLGSLINAFKQSFSQYGRGRKQSIFTSEVGKKFPYGSRIGKDSSITEFPTIIKKWSQVKRAIISGDDVVALSLKFNDNPVALLIIDAASASRGNSTVGMSWDLTKSGMTKDEMISVTNTLNKNTGKNSTFGNDEDGKSQHDQVSKQWVSVYDKQREMKKNGPKKIEYTDYEDWSDVVRAGKAKLDKTADTIVANVDDEEVGKWDKKSSKGYIIRGEEFSKINSDITYQYGKIHQYIGVTQSTSQAADFINALADQGVLKIVLIGADKVASNKRMERRNNPSAKDTDIFKDDISTRLAKYKNSKLESVEDVTEFLKKVSEGTLKKVRFQGQAFSTDVSIYSTGTVGSLIKGKEITLNFSSADPGKYNSLSIKIKLVDGVITVV